MNTWKGKNMFDYLNEVLLLTKTNRRNNTYKKAMAIKKRGDAFLFNHLCREWTSRFHWSFDPEDGKKTIATELIERTILFGGACAFSKHTDTNGTFKEESWRNYKVSAMDNLSFYGYPNRCTLVSYNGIVQKTAIPVQEQEIGTDIADCALIYDNQNRIPPLSVIFYFCERLSVINAAINGAVSNILGTTVITCSREQGKAVEKQREAAAAGVPYLILYDDYDASQRKTELLSAPGAAEELKTLFEAFDKTHADFLQAIGVRANNEMNKKSGVTPMEIIENRQNVDLILNDCYNMRLKGIEHCERLGLKGLKVSFDNFESNVTSYDNNGKLIEEKKEKIEEEKEEEKEV